MASYDDARKLMQAKDLAEVMQLQTDFVRAQFEAATEQFKQMGSAASSVKTHAVDIKTGN